MWRGRGPGVASAPRTWADRWVSLSPAITETVFALGAGRALVGRSSYCTIPPAAAALRAAGTALEPDFEALASLRPTGVLMEAAQGSQVEQVERITEAFPLPWLTLEEITRSIEDLGDLLDVAEPAQQLADTFRSALTVEPPVEGPRTLLALAADDLGHRDLWFIKRNSLHGSALHGAGLRNAVADDVDGPPRMSIEELIAVDPELIVVLSAERLDDAARQRVLHAFDHLEPLRAPKTGAVGVIDGPEALSVGPSILMVPGRLKALAADLSGDR